MQIKTIYICIRRSFSLTNIVTALTFLEEIYEEYSMKKIAYVGRWPDRVGSANFLSQRYIKNVIFYARSIRKVKTVTIFVGKKRSAGFPCLIEC